MTPAVWMMNPQHWTLRLSCSNASPRARRMLTDMTPTQRRLAELFNIQRYAPTR